MNEKILANRYRLTEQVGMGGMAIVYRAVDLRTGHNVAVKVLRPEFNEDSEFVGRFQREAEAASKMIHNNIVNLLDVGMDGENRFLVMEFVEGQTLKEMIQQRGRLYPALACQIAIRILSALEHAHRNGIIHRDIKPQNVLIHEDGHVKVADFGIARIANSSTLTKGDNVMGSVHYFSPEQAKGEQATAVSDLYSVGIVLYEMLTGRVPFDGDSPVAVAMQQIHAMPAPIASLAPAVPPAVIQICMRAMEKNPAMRYQSAREMAMDLRQAMERRETAGCFPEEAPRPPLPPMADLPQKGNNLKEKRQKKIKIFWTALTLALAISLGFLLFYAVNQIYDNIVTSAVVPNVVGYTQAEAEMEIRLQGLQVQSVLVSSNDVPAGVVFMQSPAGDSNRKKGDSVLLTVSSGPSQQAMPNLVGHSESEALEILSQMNMSQITITRSVSTGTQNVVLYQQPEAGVIVERNATVILNISGGDVIIPSFLDLTLAETEAILAENQLVLNPVLQFMTTEEEAWHGRVASQQPEGGSHAVEDAVITLSVYACPECTVLKEIQVTVPASEKDLSVRVTLQAEDSDLELTAVIYTCASSSGRTQQVNLQMPDSRRYICRVYADGNEIQSCTLEGK